MLSKRVLKTISRVIVPFVTIYQCESVFSSLVATKTNVRSRLAVEDNMHVALPTTSPRILLLTKNKQDQVLTKRLHMTEKCIYTRSM